MKTKRYEWKRIPPQRKTQFRLYLRPEIHGSKNIHQSIHHIHLWRYSFSFLPFAFAQVFVALRQRFPDVRHVSLSHAWGSLASAQWRIKRYKQDLWFLYDSLSLVSLILFLFTYLFHISVIKTSFSIFMYFHPFTFFSFFLSCLPSYLFSLTLLTLVMKTSFLYF